MTLNPQRARTDARIGGCCGIVAAALVVLVARATGALDLCDVLLAVLAFGVVGGSVTAWLDRRNDR